VCNPCDYETNEGTDRPYISLHFAVHHHDHDLTLPKPPILMARPSQINALQRERVGHGGPISSLAMASHAQHIEKTRRRGGRKAGFSISRDC
jgi:hypothetical protein